MFEVSHRGSAESGSPSTLQPQTDTDTGRSAHTHRTATLVPGRGMAPSPSDHVKVLGVYLQRQKFHLGPLCGS